jgi:hypothetical protein
VCVFGLTFFVFWEQRNYLANSHLLRRRLASLLSAYAVTMALICGYLVLKVGFWTLWESDVVFPLRYYPLDKANNTFRSYMMGWPSLKPWTQLPAFTVSCLIYALVPSVYILFLLYYHRHRKERSAEPWDKLMLLTIVGCSLFCGVATAPALVRLCSISAPAIVLFVWLLGATSSYRKLPMKLLWTWTLALAVVEPWPTWLHHSFVLDLPAGRLGFRRGGGREYAWLAPRIHPPEYMVDSSTRLYFPLRLENPSKIPSITNNGYTTAEQVQDVIDSLERK